MEDGKSLRTARGEQDLDYNCARLDSSMTTCSAGVVEGVWAFCMDYMCSTMDCDGEEATSDSFRGRELYPQQSVNIESRCLCHTEKGSLCPCEAVCIRLRHWRHRASLSASARLLTIGSRFTLLHIRNSDLFFSLFFSDYFFWRIRDEGPFGAIRRLLLSAPSLQRRPTRYPSHPQAPRCQRRIKASLPCEAQTLQTSRPAPAVSHIKSDPLLPPPRTVPPPPLQPNPDHSNPTRSNASRSLNLRVRLQVSQAHPKSKRQSDRQSACSLNPTWPPAPRSKQSVGSRLSKRIWR